MRKLIICICENKDADQLLGNSEAEQRLCFRYTDSTLSLLLKSDISSFYPASVTVQPDLCWTCSKTTLLVFSLDGLYNGGICGCIHFTAMLLFCRVMTMLLRQWLRGVMSKSFPPSTRGPVMKDCNQ